MAQATTLQPGQIRHLLRVTATNDMAIYLIGSAIPAIFAGKGASDRMDSKLIGVVVAAVFYTVMIGSLYAFGKFDI